MNRRIFLSLLSGAVSLPNAAIAAELKDAAAAFVKACEAKPEIKKKVIVDVMYTYDFAVLDRSDGTYECVPLFLVPEKFRR